MVFEIDGHDIVPFIGESGIKWTWNAIDGPNTGRNLNGRMDRDLVAVKDRCDVSLLWVKKQDVVRINTWISPKFVTVRTDTNPRFSGVRTYEMYSNNVSSVLTDEYSDGTQTYNDMSFPLIER